MRTFTEAELSLISQNGLTPEQVDGVLTMFPQNLDTAIGYMVGLKNGAGQERSEPFQGEAVSETAKEGEVDLTGGETSQT